MQEDYLNYLQYSCDKDGYTKKSVIVEHMVDTLKSNRRLTLKMNEQKND